MRNPIRLCLKVTLYYCGQYSHDYIDRANNHIEFLANQILSPIASSAWEIKQSVSHPVV